MTRLSWLPDGSEAAVRNALRVLAPELAELPLAVSRTIGGTRSATWRKGSAVIDRRFVAKFAWSRPAALAVAREGALLTRLRAAVPSLPLPEPVVTATHPAILVTRVVPGVPLDDGAGPDGREEREAADLGRFLARLHDPATLAAVRRAGVPLAAPTAQADTDALRRRLVPLVERRHGALVARWCDRADAALSVGAEEVLVHGDLHGHNQLWDPVMSRLRAVVDWEQGGRHERAFDFRYLPAHRVGPVAAAYEAAGGGPVDRARVDAWHVRTVLGDALWRTEAGVGLPDGRRVADWIEELAVRLGAGGEAFGVAHDG